MVHLDFNGIVYCDEIDGHCKECDFLGLYNTNSQCGGCPLTNFGEKFIKIQFDGTLWKEAKNSCTMTKEDVASVTSGSQTTIV